jgi:hypothetical protein
MDENGFWNLVQQAHDESGGDMDEKCELIRKALAALPPDEARDFARIYDEMEVRAYAWPLWGTAYVIGGGCSDDGFMDFRASLISRGRQAFESALANPDGLADEDLDEDTWFYEGYQYAVVDGVEAAAGEYPPRVQPYPEDPHGEEWEEDNLEALFPKLSAKYD